MTSVDVSLRYCVPPGEREMGALSVLNSVYGVRKLSCNQQTNTLKVEYDASRLTEGDIVVLLREAGMDVHPQNYDSSAD